MSSLTLGIFPPVERLQEWLAVQPADRIVGRLEDGCTGCALATFLREACAAESPYIGPSISDPWTSSACKRADHVDRAVWSISKHDRCGAVRILHTLPDWADKFARGCDCLAVERSLGDEEGQHVTAGEALKILQDVQAEDQPQ